jgi:hypothetical protein
MLRATIMAEGNWNSAEEAIKWMENWISSNRFIKGKLDTRHSRERMFQRSGLFVVDLKDCDLWWRGYIQMHRGTISFTNVTDELDCVIKLNAYGLGEFTLKRSPFDSEFTVVTFFGERGGSVVKYLNHAIKQAEKAGSEKKVKLLKKSLDRRSVA